MMNFNEMSLSEIKELVFKLYSDERAKEILARSMDEVISILEEDEACISTEDSLKSEKHAPSRKKKFKRIKKNKSKTMYNKEKKGDWAEHSRRKIKDSETTNRGFINKASRSYTPNRTQKH